MLEDRLTPATLQWRGIYAGGFSNPNNWYGTQQNQPPQANDDLYFGVVPEGRAISCVIPTAMTLYGIHLVSGYTGTVTVQDETNVGILELGRGGSIAQMGNSVDGYDLNVTKIFAFTGGTLNNTVNTGIVHLKNLSSAYIYGGTTTGSTLNIESGTTLKYGSGDITFSNLAFIHSFAGSITLPINANDPVGNFIKLNAAPPPDLIDGKFTLTKNDNGAMLVVAGGELIITKTVGISGHVDNNNPTSASLGMNGGKITITNGVGVHVQFGFAMSDGALNTVIDPALNNNQTVYIVGTMSVTGGTIELGSATASSSLQVTENVFFTGGTFKAKVFGDVGSLERDLWTTLKKFTLSAAANITPILIHAAPADAVGRTWMMVQAIGGFADTAIFPTTAVPLEWSFYYDGTPKTKLFIKKYA